MLCVCNCGLNVRNIAAQVNGGRGCQVSTFGRSSGFVNGTGLQLFHGLAHSEGSQSGNLLIPLGDGTAPGDHAVILAQLGLGLGRSGQIRGDGAGGIKGNGSGDAVDDAVTDDAIIIHQNGNHGHIVLAFACFLPGSRLAVTDAGGDVQAGLQCAFRRGNSSLGFHGCCFFIGTGGAGAVGIIHNRGARAACQQTDAKGNRQEQRDFFHNISLQLLIRYNSTKFSLMPDIPNLNIY